MEAVSRGLDRLIYNLGARSRYQAIAMLVYAGYIAAPALPRYARTGRGERAKPIRPSDRRVVREDAEELKLPPRQTAVLQGVADGLDNAVIAERLGISEETVKTTLRVVFRKLDARSRTHAVAIGLRNGLIS
jgi:DNA-binding NarL/FixJ family response regulator